MELHVCKGVRTHSSSDVEVFSYKCTACGESVETLTVRHVWYCPSCGTKYDRFGNLPDLDKSFLENVGKVQGSMNVLWNTLFEESVKIASIMKSSQVVSSNRYYLDGLERFVHDFITGSFYSHLRGYFENEDPLGPNKALNLQKLVEERANTILAFPSQMLPSGMKSPTIKVESNGLLSEGMFVYYIKLTYMFSSRTLYQKTWRFTRKLNGKSVKVRPRVLYVKAISI